MKGTERQSTARENVSESTTVGEEMEERVLSSDVHENHFQQFL